MPSYRHLPSYRQLGNRKRNRNAATSRNSDSHRRDPAAPCHARFEFRSDQWRYAAAPCALIPRRTRSAISAVLFATLLAGGSLGLSLEGRAQEAAAKGGASVPSETPLSPEAQAAVQSVLRTFRSPPPTPDRPIVALALEVSRTEDLVVDALAETRSGESARAREALTTHARRIVKLRQAIAANTEPTDRARAAEAQAGPYLDELTAALNHAGSEPQASRRASQLVALLERIQNGELPVRQPYRDSRSPMIRWLREEPRSAGGAAVAPQAGVDDAQTEGAGE